MIHASRRSFIGGSLALGTALALPSRALAAATTKPASSFFQSLGINGHAWYVNNAWPQRLTELGVPNFRTKVARSKDLITKISPFLSSGGKIDSLIVSSSGNTLDKTEAATNIDFLKNYVGVQHLCGIEGPNEFNSNYQTCPGWAADLRSFVQWSHDSIRADATFRSVPLIAPSIWKRLTTDYKALGDVSQWTDKGCIHFYSGNRRPTITGNNTMPGALSDASKIAPRYPIWMTESGWQAPSGNIPISPRAHAKYTLRDYFDAFGFGVEKLFTYQLMDDQSNMFGLCDAYANPKPAFYALKNLTALVKDQYASSGALGFTVSSAPSSLKTFSFSKSDGSFLLAFYLDVESYDLRARKDIETAIPITINLSAAARKIEVYKPTFDASVQASGSGAQIPLFAIDQLTVLKIWF